MSDGPRVLVVDDEPNIRATFRRALDLEGFAVAVAADGDAALAELDATPADLVLLDLRLPGRDGLDVLRALRARPQPPAVVMMSGHGTLESAVQATRLGALDFLEKPVSVDRLLLTVRNALQLDALREEVVGLRDAIVRRHGIVGRSRAIEGVLDAVRAAAPTSARVLVTGETGVGKELVARALHALSRRARGPFVQLNCAALPEHLVESELFGHERGAFTGAERRHAGRFERAHGGTLFLDEVGDMAAATQARLLRVLQEGEVERVGGSAPIPVDVRVVAATHRDLRAEVDAGRFRGDLFYRLSVVPIHVPALRDRRADVPALARYLLEESCRRNDLLPRELTDEALVALTAHDWPGNVRELGNVIDRLAVLARGSWIREADVRGALPGGPPPLAGDEIPQTGTLAELLLAFERRVLEDRIDACGGNMTRAAEDLGLERSNLYKKLRRLGVTRD